MNELETDPYDEFIDSLPGNLRLKVVKSLSEPDAPTEGTPAPPETPPSATSTALEPWERVLLVLAVLPVLVALGIALISAHVVASLSSTAMEAVVKWTQEKAQFGESH